MTFVRRNYGSGHGYLINGVKVVGVTTVLSVLDKPALVSWAAKQSAGYAIEHWSELSELPLMERATKIEKARFATNKKAIVRGHRIHEFGEKLAHGEAVEVPEEYRQPAELYARFLDDWELETVATETPVASTQYQYAGTFDAVARSPKLGQVLFDVKTGRGVYDEVALQLAAYRFADVRLDADGDERPMFPTESTAYVAHVTSDSVDLLPVVADEEVWRVFLHLVEIHESWVKRTGYKFRGEPSYAPPVGDVLFPDQVAGRELAG